MKPATILTAALLCALSPFSFAKPLKVFILAGQSNMEGHAAISTFDYIGKGIWNHSGITLEKSPSTWGNGEFLLMRTTFEVEDLDFESFRIANLARQGFHVYLNGNKIHTYIWWQDKPVYGSIVLEKEQIQYLKKGKNVLAVYANDQYEPNSPERYAAIDMRIEGITKADQEKLDLALEEVLSPKDREVLKGASNAGYHYFGSAKIFAQMGKTFAEALVNLKK